MMFFTSDLHIGHARINELAGRPFDSVDEMNAMLIDNWNQWVKEDDTVFILGDLCMGKIAESLPLLSDLNGMKFLVPGNHDRMHSSYDKREWKRAEWTEKYNQQGVVVLKEQFDLTLPNGTVVNICHFPYSGDSHGDEDRYSDLRPEDDGRWLLHGHVHEAWRVNGRQINVGVDVWHFTPVTVETLMMIIEDPNGYQGES